MIVYEFFDEVLLRIPAYANERYKNPDAIIRNNFFEESIRLASEELYNMVYPVKESHFDDLPGKQKKALLKYVNRTCTRCTPFGNFAGTGLVKIDSVARIDLGAHPRYINITSLDIEFFTLFSDRISELPDLSGQFLYYPNSTIYKLGKRLRYIERKLNKRDGDFLLSSVLYSKAISEILKFSSEGVNKDSLIDFILEKKFTNTSEEAKGFIVSLIQNQLIISEFWPGTTSDNTRKISLLIEKYKNSIPKNLHYYYEHCKASIDELNAKPPGKKLNLINEFETYIKTNSNIIDTKNRFLTITNLYVNPDKGAISSQICDLLMDALKILNVLKKNKRSIIEEFKGKFYEKYEYEEIPLTEVLDPDVGIGFGSFTSEAIRKNALLKGMTFNEKQGKAMLPVDNDVTTNAFLLKKYTRFLEGRDDAIHLNADDFIGIEPDWETFPLTFSAGIEVIKAGNKGDPLIFMKFAGGYSANSILGRFSTDVEEVNSLIKKVKKFEDMHIPKDSIFAEIVYMPDELSHTKVLTRNTIHSYEIPILSASGVDAEHQILLSDLYLSITGDNTLILRSKRLNKRINPRNSTADAFTGSSNPFYYFLSAMQANGNIRPGLSYDLRDPTITNGYYPRIVYEKKIILSPATWFLNLLKITDKTINYDNFLILKNEMKIPDKVLSVYGDNKLLIDFNTPYGFELLSTEIKKGNFILEEYFDFNEDPLVVSGDEIYNNELVFSLYRKSK